MGHQWYKLDKDHNPIAMSFEQMMAEGGTSNEQVNFTAIENVRVSTVFLGMDHSFGGATPVLYETLIFGGEHDMYQQRYCTWAEAEAGHVRAVKMAIDGSKLNPARDED